MATRITRSDPRYALLHRSRNLRWDGDAAEAVAEISLCETAEQAAGREAWEEASLPTSAYKVTGRYVDDHGGWSYVTVLASARERVRITTLNAESTEVAWVRQDELRQLPLHPGFAASWPSVSALLDA